MPTLAPEAGFSFRRGMNDTAAPLEYQRDEVALLLNGRVSFDGNTIERRDGSKRRHGTALNSGAQGYGGTEFFKPDGTQQLVVFVGDKMYYSEDEGATWTNPAGATSLRTDYWSLKTMRVGTANYLCAANGSASVYYWDGTTWGTLTNWSSGIKYLAMLNDRLFGAGHNGDRIEGSAVQDPNTQELDLKYATHDGDTEITGLFSMGETLLAFKRKSVGYLMGYGFHDITVQAGARGVSRSVGCIAFRTIHAVGDSAVMWLSERGFEFWQPGGPIQLVSRPVQKFIDTAQLQDVLTTPGAPVAMYWSKKNEYICALPAGGTGSNDYRFRYRPPTGDAPGAIMLDLSIDAASTGYTLYVEDGALKVSDSPDRSLARVENGGLRIATGSEPGFFVSITGGGLQIENGVQGSEDAVLFSADQDNDVAAPWSVGYDGFVRRLETGNSDNVASDGTGGNTINMKVALRPMVWGDPMRKKRARVVRIWSQQDAEASIQVVMVADGNPATARTLTMPASSGRPIARKTMVNTRAHAAQIELQTTDKVLIAGAELRAHLLAERV